MNFLNKDNVVKIIAAALLIEFALSLVNKFWIYKYAVERLVLEGSISAFIDILLLLMLPAAAILLLKEKKEGWFLSLFVFGFSSCISVYMYVSYLIKSTFFVEENPLISYYSQQAFPWKVLYFAAWIYALMLPTTREKLQVSKQMAVKTALATAALAGIVFLIF